MWPAIIGALSSVAGGAITALVRRRAEARNAERQDNQLQRMAADARVAGIHPVAALGTSANYGSPIFDGQSPFGDAVGEAGARVAESLTRRRERSEDLAIENQRLQNEALQLDIQGRSLALAEAQSRTFLRQIGGALRAPSSDIIVSPPSADGSTAIQGPIGGPVVYAPTSSAQAAEDRYGGILGEFYGLGNFIRDLAGPGHLTTQEVWPSVGFGRNTGLADMPAGQFGLRFDP